MTRRRRRRELYIPAPLWDDGDAGEAYWANRRYDTEFVVHLDRFGPPRRFPALEQWLYDRRDAGMAEPRVQLAHGQTVPREAELA